MKNICQAQSEQKFTYVQAFAIDIFLCCFDMLKVRMAKLQDYYQVHFGLESVR